MIEVFGRTGSVSGNKQGLLHIVICVFIEDTVIRSVRSLPSRELRFQFQR